MYQSFEMTCDTQGYFLSIVERFLREANDSKIEQWKNAMVHLMTDFRNFDYKDSYLVTLEALTAFDLTVLSQIYILNESEHLDLMLSVLQFFEKKEAPEELVVQAIRRLAAQNLISELESPGMTFTSMNPLKTLNYRANVLGHDFIKFMAGYNN
jgi:hypothetical protein